MTQPHSNQRSWYDIEFSQPILAAGYKSWYDIENPGINSTVNHQRSWYDMDYPDTDFDQLFAQARERNTSSTNVRPGSNTRNGHTIQSQTQRPRIAAQTHHLAWHDGENFDHLFDSGGSHTHRHHLSSTQGRHSPSRRHSRQRRRTTRPQYDRQRSQSMDDRAWSIYYGHEDPFDELFQRACRIQDGRPSEQRVRYGRQVSHSADEVDDIEIRLNDSPLESVHAPTTHGTDSVDKVFVPPPATFTDTPLPNWNIGSGTRPISPLSRLLASHDGENFDHLFAEGGAYSQQNTDHIPTNRPHHHRHSICTEADHSVHNYIGINDQRTHRMQSSHVQGEGQRARSHSYHGYTDDPPSYAEVVSSTSNENQTLPAQFMDEPPPNYEQSLLCPRVTTV